MSRSGLHEQRVQTQGFERHGETPGRPRGTRKGVLLRSESFEATRLARHKEKKDSRKAETLMDGRQAPSWSERQARCARRFHRPEVASQFCLSCSGPTREWH